MKKIISLLSLVLLSLLMVSCNNDDIEVPAELPTTTLSSEVSILTPGGTPYLAIGGLLVNEKINVTVAEGPDVLQTSFPKGSYDIIIAPVNLGTMLYNKGNSKYQMSHVITGNNAYIVTKAENKLDSIADLEGQDILAFGKSASIGIPGSILKKAYEQNSLDTSKIKYEYANSVEVYQAFVNNLTDAKYALMSEPEISKLVLKDKIEVKTLDLSQVLGASFAQACVYVNPNSENQDDINKVLGLIDEMIKFLNTNTEFYADTVIPLDRKFEAMSKDVIVRSVPLTNIVFKEAKSNKNDVINTLNMLGVPLPKDEFYR